ncbi:MAG: uL15m family ribosomal protein [Candidatus Micrarchaeota archaeon]
MVRRHKKKSRKYLASRHWGGGNTKNRRGKGNKGGKGYAGSHKHKWTYMVKYEPEHFGRRGFASLRGPSGKVINLGDITQMIKDGKLGKSGDRFNVEVSEYKVLGGGALEFPVSIKARAFSAGAEEKIKEAGGEAIAITETSKKEKEKAEKGISHIIKPKASPSESARGIESESERAGASEGV